MGYACPVCGDPQSDDVHLANHLAFTALSRGGDHEEWLDGTVPEWGSMNESTLADEVTAHAEETEYPQVFEDTTGSHDHDGHAHGRAGGTRDLSEAMLSQAEAELDDLETRDTEDVLEQARELTEKRHADESSETE
jgi:hypothetical protein